MPGTSHLDREEIAKAMKHGEGFSIRRHSQSTGGTYFYAAKRGNGYVVRSAVPYTVSLNQLLAADYVFLWFMLMVTIVMCIIGFFATRRVGRHVERLNQFAEMAERGERIFDTEPFPNDELGNISGNIVRLYARLQQAIADRDRQHRIALHEQQEKHRIKRQLTNNINHELKTPVASMQVCLETLIQHKNLPEEKRNEFIARCYAANERLRKLLADVSVITRMEDGGGTIERTPVNICDIASEICSEYDIMAKEKGVVISNGITYGQPITGNASLLESVFRNLIDNALAYSGANHIELKQKDTDNGYLSIVVADNGSGVAPEHLPHLFERFYRIDKGRSRQVGGTGLGLSIVRNAVAWHGGTITVENRREGGLAFTFTLKTE
jgi:signal transduction histidine kinase